MRDSHDGYPCREPELLASLHAAEAALRQARRLMKCHAIEDEQGRREQGHRDQGEKQVLH